MTQPNSPVVDAKRRSWNYWFIDGLPTLAAGILSALMGLTMMAYNAPMNRPMRLAIAVVGLLVYWAVMLRMGQILQWLKARITYPRTGYAAPPEDGPEPPDVTVFTLRPAETLRFFDFPRLVADGNRRMRLLVGAGVAGALFGLATKSTWACLAAGVMVGFAVFVGNRRSERASWLEVAAFPFAGLYVFIFHVPPAQGVALLFLIGGCLFAVSGAFRLVRYVRRNPILIA